MFLFQSRNWKKSSTSLNFFQSLANDDVKVNKTQKVYAKVDRFRTRLFVWILMQLISQSERGICPQVYLISTFSMKLIHSRTLFFHINTFFPTFALFWLFQWIKTKAVPCLNFFNKTNPQPYFVLVFSMK